MASKRRVVIRKWDETNRDQFEGPPYWVLAGIIEKLDSAEREYRDLEFEYNSDGEYILTGVAR